MNLNSFIPIIGTIVTISRVPNDCCSQMISISANRQQSNFIISSHTFVADSTRLRVGMRIAAFYDSSRPIPLIFPPQYQAELICILMPNESIMLNFFNRNLTSADQSLTLHIGSRTTVTTQNGQIFACSPGGNTLLVYYSATTRSIPPQTTPRKIIVMC
ncbi:MAG: hypothetical protein RR063_09265 [Anaerovoracaceae bacterium]